MPRIYTRKSTRGAAIDVLERAHQRVKDGASLRTAANDFHINRMTLKRFIEKRNADPGASFGYVNCRIMNMTFTLDMERDLAKHIKHLARMFHGLSKEKVLELAYKFAIANSVSMPSSWQKNKKAGQDFWLSFKNRNGLTIRSPEATSLARASAFNRHTVGEFYQNLATVMDCYKFSANDIFNLDETGVHTVQDPGHVVSEIGIKQVGSITSAERGELVTLVYTISASGSVIPPMYIFPRVHFKEFFLRGAPNGSIGRARNGGWINEALFLDYLDYLAHQTRCSKERKILLILDNHESHVSLDVIDFARESGIVLLTIPPHTSHKLQPLDKSCFGPFKTAFNKAMDNWQRTHPGKTVTIYDIPELTQEAHSLAFTQRNITAGFKSTGIYPYNTELFSDVDFAPSDVTDRPDPEFQEEFVRYIFTGDEPETDGPHSLDVTSETTTCTTEQPPENEMVTGDLDIVQSTFPTPIAGPSGEPSSDQPSTPKGMGDLDIVQSTSPTPIAGPSGEPSSDQPSTPKGMLPRDTVGGSYVSPHEIQPVPKAGPRKNAYSRRRKKTTILTASPFRNTLAAMKALKEKKSQMPKSKARKSIQLTQDSDSDDLDIEELCCEIQCEEDPSQSDDENPTIELTNVAMVKSGDFIIAQFATKKTARHYIAEVLEGPDEDDDIQVQFFKRVGKQNTFAISEESASLPLNDVRYVLPPPIRQGTTNRTSGIISFPVNFGDIVIS